MCTKTILVILAYADYSFHLEECSVEERKTNSAGVAGESKMKIQLNGISFEVDKPMIIMGPAISSETEIENLQLEINEETKKHNRMCYSTDLRTLGLIIQNMTIRSSSLTNAKLNDQKEKERVGVTQFAGGRFITCFSHIDHESVPFWASYGEGEKAKKLFLKFRNFAGRFDECINTDCCLIADDKKLFFYSNEYHQTLRNNSLAGQMAGAPQINTEFDIRNCVRSVEMFDVDYILITDEAFEKDYSGEVNLDMSKFSSNPEQVMLEGIRVYRPDCLGRQKSIPWDYEKESRIMCCLEHQESSKYAYIDLRLKPEIFRDLVIVLSPWIDATLEGQVRELIDHSSLPTEIKESIIIEHSELEGTLNL